MPQTRPELTLAEPLEADISDFHTSEAYLHLPNSQGSLASSTAASSASPSVVSLNESFRDIPPTPQQQFGYAGLQRKQSLSLLSSPSSPSLVTSFSVAERLKHTRPSLPRSYSLPRVDQVEVKQRKRVVDVDNIVVEPEVIRKLRRWIMGIAVGVFCATPPLELNSDRSSVEFDLDDGPVVDAVVPPLFLLPSESNNMCVSPTPLPS